MSERTAELTTHDMYNLDAACRLITRALGMDRTFAGGGDATPWGRAMLAEPAEKGGVAGG